MARVEKILLGEQAMKRSKSWKKIDGLACDTIVEISHTEARLVYNAAPRPRLEVSGVSPEQVPIVIEALRVLGYPVHHLDPCQPREIYEPTCVQESTR